MGWRTKPNALALYRRPRTTKPEPGHKIYPYLLRGIEITRPNQVWAMDITYSAPRPEESGKRMFGMQ
jgi:putative transposase